MTYFRWWLAAHAADELAADAFLNETWPKLEGEHRLRVRLSPEVEFHFLNGSSRVANIALFETWFLGQS